VPKVSSEREDFVRDFYASLNRRDYGAVRRALADGLVHHAAPNGKGPDAVLHMLQTYHSAFPDLRHTVEDVIAGADRIAVRTRTTGTHLGAFLGHLPSGRSFSAEALAVLRLDNGLIREVWEIFDTIAMLQQLGLYAPAPAEEAGPSPVQPGKPLPGPQSDIPLAELRSDPLGFLEGLVARYGSLVRYVCEGRDTILLNEPTAIRHVLHENEQNYSKLGTPDLLLLKPMLGDGLLTTVGPVWREDRQLIQPRLSRRRMKRLAAPIVQVVDGMCARWQARPDPLQPIDIVRELSRLTLEIAARVLFSTNLSPWSERFGAAMDVLNESLGRAHQAGPSGDGRLHDALAEVRGTVRQMILARRLYDPGDDDLLATLLRAQRERGDSDKRLIDQAVTILLAGHETTAKALSWAIGLLDRHPDAAARLLEEVQLALDDRPPGAEDLPRLAYTRAVIDEALRLRPPIWMLTRTALNADTICGYAIPRGALIGISPYLLHRHPEHWEHPDRFMPERFLDGDGGATQAYRYIPFGHGSRYCVGKFFAMLEMPLVLARIYTRFSLTGAPGHRLEADALVTMRPRDGLPMLVAARPARRLH
jgi:steroid delta-isomerase-like uncharacterized protein